MDVLKEQAIDKTKLGGRELLDLIIRKWGVAYDIQLRKLKPFGDGSENIYINIMWRCSISFIIFIDYLSLNVTILAKGTLVRNLFR